MTLEALGVSYVTLKAPEWALILVAIAAMAVVAWDNWDTRTGNYRPVLKVVIGIILSFLAGMSVERGIGNFRLHAGSRRWILEVLLGLLSLVMSIIYVVQRRKEQRSVIEWLNERNKPPLLFDKKND
jgi:uncharacterized membrane protein YfcA